LPSGFENTWFSVCAALDGTRFPFDTSALAESSTPIANRFKTVVKILDEFTDSARNSAQNLQWRN
jgi:hypothetical protein